VLLGSIRILSASHSICLHGNCKFVYFLRINPIAVQKKFLGRVADFRPFKQLLDLLPDVAFFVKDRRGCFIMNNRLATEACGVNSEAATLGKVGAEFFQDGRLALYRKQDEQVMRTGKPIINAICPAPQRGNDTLIIYSKVPLRDRRGKVIGLAGIWREVGGLKGPPATLGRLSMAVELMQRDYAGSPDFAALAKTAGLSRSQFDRQFRRLFGCSPREHLLYVRIDAASRLLETTAKKTVDIALETGFYDHSHFCRTFRRLVGCTPLTYRRRNEPTG